MASKSGFNLRNLFSPARAKNAEKEIAYVPATSEVASRSIAEPRTNPRQLPAKDTLILIVEDSKTVQLVLKKMFTEAGYQVLQAYEGTRGVAMAKQYRPNLIMMDVVMPGMTGFQATREIRKDPDIGKMPIVIMSGSKQATEQFWANKIGANEYMMKPFSRVDLFAVVEQQLRSDAEIGRQARREISGEYIQPDDSYEYQKWLDAN